jgi:carbamoyltransferase
LSYVLGISAFYHDSAAALIRDGEIVAAVQEERFSRKKHDARFPARALDACLAEAGITPEQLDYVTFYEQPLVKFERLLETYMAYAPRGFASFRRAIPAWLRQKLHIPREIRRGLGGGYKGRIFFPAHHESHAASAFFPSPFEDAAIVTSDGVGEWSTTVVGAGRGNHIELDLEIRFPHSLGLLYSAFTDYCGFAVNSGEYKLMGLAPYGEPGFVEQIKRALICLKPDGSYRLNPEYFTYSYGLTMTGSKFARLFGGPPRQPEALLEQRHMDLAAKIGRASCRERVSTLV